MNNKDVKVGQIWDLYFERDNFSKSRIDFIRHVNCAKQPTDPDYCCAVCSTVFSVIVETNADKKLPDNRLLGRKVSKYLVNYLDGNRSKLISETPKCYFCLCENYSNPFCETTGPKNWKCPGCREKNYG